MENDVDKIEIELKDEDGLRVTSMYAEPDGTLIVDCDGNNIVRLLHGDYLQLTLNDTWVFTTHEVPPTIVHIERASIKKRISKAIDILRHGKWVETK